MFRQTIGRYDFLSGIGVKSTSPSSNISTIRHCFGYDSASMKDVITVEPGWKILRSSSTSILLMASCSWPQMVKSIQSGMCLELIHLRAGAPALSPFLYRFW
jgi:hypothetical protein